MFSLDTESGFRDAVFVTGAYGLGKKIVQGAVDAGRFYVHKPTYLAGHRAVLRRLLGDKAVKMILVDGETKNTTRNIPTPKADRAASASPTTTSWNWPATPVRSRRTTAARWTWSGPRTVWTVSSTLCRPALRRWPPSTA